MTAEQSNRSAPQVIRVPTPLRRPAVPQNEASFGQLAGRSLRPFMVLMAVFGGIFLPLLVVWAIRSPTAAPAGLPNPVLHILPLLGALALMLVTLSITVSLGVRADRKRLATAAERQRTEGSKPSRGFPAYLALPWLVNLVALFVAAWVAVDLVVKAKKTGTLAGLTPVQFAAVVTAVFGLICVVSALAVWAALRLRLGFLAQSEMPPKPIEVSPDEAAQQLARQWPALRPPPKLPAVQAALNLLPQDVSPPARIVVLGDFELPEVGDLRFEPEVFSPTRLLGTRLIVAAGVVGAGLAWWALGYTGFVPWAARDNPFTMTVYLVIPALVLWVWRGALRATYLRLAPGVVQVLVYQYPWSKKPTIRDYPIEGGTLAVVANSAYGLKLTLARGSQKDTVTFSLLAKKKEATDRLLEALLSTAPRPPLSLTALVG